MHTPGQSECCHSHPSASRPWYKNFVFYVSAAAAVLLLLSFSFSGFALYHHVFLRLLKVMFLPVLAGLLLGGFVERYVPKEYISKHLAGRKKRTVFYAAFLGFLMSACNHGIIALSLELHKKGASGPAVIAFLLASPWANLPVTLLLITFFGIYGVLMILSALAVAMLTGLVFLVLDEKGWIERNPHTVAVEQGFSMRGDLFRRWQERKTAKINWKTETAAMLRGSAQLAGMILGWIILGMILASLGAVLLPPEVMQKYFGPSLLGLLVTLCVAALLEVCSEGTSPMAFELYRQTGALGNAFAFLMGGVITDFTEIGFLWSNIGKKTAFWMVAVALPQVIVLAWCFNRYLS